MHVAVLIENVFCFNVPSQCPPNFQIREPLLLLRRRAYGQRASNSGNHTQIRRVAGQIFRQCKSTLLIIAGLTVVLKEYNKYAQCTCFNRAVYAF